jgi:hypothetical protein
VAGSPPREAVLATAGADHSVWLSFGPFAGRKPTGVRAHWAFERTEPSP